MKKCIFLLLALLIPLSACGGTAQPAPTEQLNTATPTEVPATTPAPTETPQVVEQFEFTNAMNDISLAGTGERAIAIFRENGKWPVQKLDALPELVEGFGYDLRWADVSGLDFSGYTEEEMSKISFNEDTVWPDEIGRASCRERV